MVDESIFTADSPTKRSVVKRGLLKIRAYQCESCGLAEWLGKPISLELHHKNGQTRDNRLENLQLLCPNCHAQTDTYRGRNIKRTTEPRLCCDCQTTVSKRARRCVACALKRPRRRVGKLVHMTDSAFLALTQGRAKSQVARELNVSETAVRNRLKRLADVAK